jgi:hypothetical protein
VMVVTNSEARKERWVHPPVNRVTHERLSGALNPSG